MHADSLNNIILVGKPNTGKTSLFNRLTGLNHKVGNYSGVTIEVLKGKFKTHQIIDIPGLQSLNTRSPEEVISKQEIIKGAEQQRPIIFVANSMQLFDSLMLFSQIADLQTPMMLAINFTDEAQKHDLKIDKVGLHRALGCPVVMLNSRSGQGFDELKKNITENNFTIPNTICRSNYDHVEGDNVINHYTYELREATKFTNWEDDYSRRQKVLLPIITQNLKSSNSLDYLANTHKWDNILLHPFWGILIFFATLYIVFQSVFFFSSFPMEWIDSGFAYLSGVVHNNINTPWLQKLIGDAIIPGISGVLIFIPQIAILFFLIGILEQIGYLSRISFISDAFLKKFGLSGHSVIPLVSSWACAIPAIMSTRVIENPKERLTAILTLPLMTCSARLPVYVILIAVLFPTTESSFFGVQGLFLLALYLLGVIATLVMSWLVSKYSKAPSNSNWMLELPVFRRPNWQSIGVTVFSKTKSFVVQAGKIIFLVAIVLWFLANWSPKSDAFLNKKTQQNTTQSSEAIALEYSYLGYMGKFVEPVIKPLGYDWKIGIALISSFAAREVFVGTLSSIYSIGSNDEQTIVQKLRTEKDEQGNNRYDWGTSVSLLLFYVFSMQCMSTMAVVKKETGEWKYVIFQFAYMLVLAYGSAWVAYMLLS